MRHHELGAKTLHMEIVAERLFTRACIAEACGQFGVIVSTEEIATLAADIREAAGLYRSAHQELIAKGNG